MKKNGFTLIEMLAVVSILGILFLFIFVKTKPAISDSKESSYYLSANSLVTRLEEYYFKQKMSTSFNGCKVNFDENYNDCTDFVFSGDKPDGGIITVSVDGVISGSIKYGEFIYNVSENKIVE